MDSDPAAVASLVLSIVTLILIISLFILSVPLVVTRLGSDLPLWDARVLGEWARLARRKMSWFPLGFATELELPVIFLAPADNKRGPVVDQEIWYIDGTTKSCEQTRTPLAVEILHNNSFSTIESSARERIHTVANDRASWITLLEALQRMERDSTNWEGRRWREKEGRPRPDLVEVTSLVVGVQRYRRVFNGTSTFKRPFATSTICHLVELAAVLGLYWKQFDRGEDKYRAEGNGYSLRGTRVDDFGPVFTFERMGWSKFEEKRVIPTSAVKELSFGNAPTFYRPMSAEEDDIWQDPNATRQQNTLKTLQLGSRREIAATLGLVGCNQDTIWHFLSEESNVHHLFPVVFEVLGMLGRTFYVRHRCFTRLPNPTIFSWNKRSFSLRRLLAAFCKNLDVTIDLFPRHVPSDMEFIQAVAHQLDLDLPTREDGFSPADLDRLHESLSRTDNILNEGNTPKPILLDVLRRHLQVLLVAINPHDAEGAKDEDMDPLFEPLFTLPPEYREHELMRVYFTTIRPRVVQVSSPESNVRPDSRSGAADASLKVHLSSNETSEEQRENTLNKAYTFSAPTDFDARRNTIWCTLVFRMICWLLLHDFDENDIQISKSEVMGSRLPVYIV